MKEITSSLLNDKYLVKVKESLLAVSMIDNEEDFRVKMLEYINDTASDNDDKFFYDMIEFVRFLNPNNDAIAYTDPYKQIFLNSPGHIGKNIRFWDFIYCHECLHQLWETFGVEEKLKEEDPKGFDHYLLNIASDCVINDYLYALRKKQRPNDLITPEYLEKKYGVTYDRKNDTQYTLYKKLIAAGAKEIEKMHQDPMLQQNAGDGQQGNGQPQGGGQQQGGQQGGGQQQDGQQGDGQQQGGNQGGGQQQGGSQGGGQQSGGPQGGGQQGDQKGDGGFSGSSDDAIDKMSGDEAAQDAANSAKAAKDALDKAKNSIGQGNGDPADDLDKMKKTQDAADRAEAAAKKAKDCADKGDDEGARKAAKEARDAAKEAVDAANGNQGGGQQGGDQQNGNQEGGKQGNQKGGNGKNPGNEKGSDINGGQEMAKSELEKIKERADKIIKKWQNKIAGDFGRFISKCKASAAKKETGLKVETYSGNVSWNQQMNKAVNAFVKKRVWQKKREFEETYSRFKRGSGYVKYGDFIMPGEKEKENGLVIDVAFYIDRSGSMGANNALKNVFKACIHIGEALRKHFSKEKVVKNIKFKQWVFDTRMQELEFGKTCSDGGGTMSFDELLSHINDLSKDFMINIIITDAQFNVNESEVMKFAKGLGGLILFITNEDNPTVKRISDQMPKKLVYILADSSFTIK